MADNKTQSNDTHIEAMTRWDMAYGAERPQRDQCIEDMEFAQVSGMQWDDLAQQSRANRPRYEINKLALHINQVVGDQRQNRTTINVRPSKNGAQQDIAEAYKGLIRNIENDSRFKDSKDNAFFEVCNGGIGAWYVTTEYNANDSFEQDIVIKTVRSAATSVFFDPGATEENKQDAMWAFVSMDISKEEFKAKYPKKTESSMPRTYDTQTATPWIGRDTLRIADYWVKEPYMKEIAQMSDGSVIELTENVEKVLKELSEQQPPVFIAKDAKGKKQIRKVKDHRVTYYKISGSEILEGPRRWAGRYIPVVPVFGYNIWINGRHYYRGMVRLAKDAQRVYNYATSSAIEQTALAPKDPFWVTPTQIQGYEKDFTQFNVTNNPFQRYNPDPKAPGPPQRGGAPAVQQALIAQISQADQDIMATTGRFSPSLGDNPGEQSGRAVLAQQAKGDLGTEMLNDNLVKAIEYTGVILVDLIPRIYDTERQLRIVGDDGTNKLVPINKVVKDMESGDTVIINDLTQGKYDVTVDTGPAYATKRIEVLNTLNALAQSNPQFAQMAPDLMAKMVDFEYAPELSRRFRKMLLQQRLIEPTEEEADAAAKKQPSPAEQMQFKAMQLDLEQKAANIDQMEIDNEYKKLELDKIIAETAKILADAVKSKTDAVVSAAEGGVLPGQTEAEKAAYDKNIGLLNQEIESAQQELFEKEASEMIDKDINASQQQPVPGV